MTTSLIITDFKYIVFVSYKQNIFVLGYFDKQYFSQTISLILIKENMMYIALFVVLFV